MASWRAPGSILRAPGLDFGGSWDEFFEILGFWTGKLQELISNLPLKLRGSSLEARVARSSYSNPEFQPRFPKRVGGGDPPPGVFNPLPTEGVPSVRDSFARTATSNTKTPTSKALLQVSHENLVLPLPIIPPRARPVHRKPDAKKRKSFVFSHFWSIFRHPKRASKTTTKKTSKKMRKSRILASQTLPKSPSNRRSKKTAFFHAFFV